MKRLIDILLFVLFSFPASLAQNSFSSKVTANMKQDIASLNNHMKAKSSPAILAKDLSNLLFHMIPQKGLKSEEIVQIGYKLQKYQEYYDLEAACRLALALMKIRMNEEKEAQDILNGIEFHIQSKLNEHSSSFQDFICALAKYRYLVPNRADGVTDFGSNAPTTGTKTETVKNVVFIRSELRRIEQIGLKPSSYALANELLLLVLKNLYQKQVSTSTSLLNKEIMTQINKVMSSKLDSYIHQWVELQYPAQYIVNPINDTGYTAPSIKERDQKKIYASIRELSIQGYGPASYLVGSDYEKAPTWQEKPQEAFKYYLLASNQGAAAGTIRLASCYAFGYGCSADLKKSYEILKPLVQNVEFPQNGAYAYAVLLEKGFGGKTDILDIMEFYTMAAEKGFKTSERNLARERIKKLYEKYYK